MIQDHISQLGFYTSLHPDFGIIADWFATSDVLRSELGSYQVPSTELTYSVQKKQGDPEHIQLERHNRMIDVHITLEGTDIIGWKPQNLCIGSKGFQNEHDVELYTDSEVQQKLYIPANHFCIFFSQDSHAPWMAIDTVKKVVCKVPVL